MADNVVLLLEKTALDSIKFVPGETSTNFLQEIQKRKKRAIRNRLFMMLSLFIFLKS
jgi:hypothetical protein